MARAPVRQRALTASLTTLSAFLVPSLTPFLTSTGSEEGTQTTGVGTAFAEGSVLSDTVVHIYEEVMDA